MLLRRLVFFFVFVLSATLALPVQGQYYSHFGRNKVQYEDFDWHVLKTDHFDVYFYPEMQELAENGAHFAETVYDELENKFNFSLNHRVPLIFYSSNLHFKQTNITPGFIPDGVGGFFEFLKGRVVIPANGNLHRFRRVIRHELVHVFTYSKVLRVMRDHRIPPDRFLPLWFTEGLAEYWSGEQDYQYEMVMRDAVFSNYLVPLENMYRIHGTYLMYKQGEGIFKFISETYGEEKILELIENAWQDRDFRRVMEVTLKDDFEEISRRWQLWLKDQYFPLMDDLELPSLIAGGVATKGFNAKPAFYRHADGTRKVYYVGNMTGYSNVYEVTLDEDYRPLDEPKVLIRGERDQRFEAFHLFESRLSVSPDGKLAFVTKSGGHDVIHVYDLDRDEMGPTYRFEDLVAVYSPSWSPDGQRLAFSSIDQSGFSDLYVYDTGAGTLQKLTDDAYDDRDPAWSPDGQLIAFSSDRTALGEDGFYNLFTYALDSGQISYATYGPRHDLSPSWSPDGRHLVFTSTRRDTTGRYDAQNIWAVDMSRRLGAAPAVASATPSVDETALSVVTGRELRQLTALTSAAFDPVWTKDDQLLFAGFEHFRFTIRHLPDVDSLLAHPRRQEEVDLADTGEHWAFARVGVDTGAERAPYRRKYQLDIAQGQVSQNAVWGTTGGAVMAFSDMLGDDYWYVMMYSNSRGQDDFLKSLNVAVTRVQLKKRTNFAYGLYRYGGLRYDRTDPDAASEFPVFWETIYGGFGAVSYPISKFRRVELSSSLSWSDKEVLDKEREALLLSNQVSLVHDNALYYMNGPIDGWRANASLAYTTDIRYSNVSYWTGALDVRHYWRILPSVTFASWGMVRANHGREARLFLLGGSWDLRFQRFLRVRGKKMWFTSHELRFPLLNAPSLYLPLLAPFGISGIKGALFFDAAHAWNEDYYAKESQLNTGETLGALGAGLRMNLFGGFVLRYDIGYSYRNGFRDRDDGLRRQFFFGYDF